MNNRIKQLINIEIIEVDQDSNYYHALRTMLDVLFFLYEVSPSVNASYKLSTSIIFIVKFCKRHNVYEEEIAHKIFGLTNDLMLNESNRIQSNSLERFIHLEFLNILLAVRELGEFYLLPEKTLMDLFFKQGNLSYFTVISCLFYMKDEKQYNNIRLKLTEYIDQQLSNLEDVTFNSEKAYLLLDILSCPYVSTDTRKNLVKKLSSILKLSLDNSEIEDIASSLESQCWHTDWKNVDLLNLLEKKELKQSYS